MDLFLNIVGGSRELGVLEPPKPVVSNGFNSSFVLCDPSKEDCLSGSNLWQITSLFSPFILSALSVPERIEELRGIASRALGEGNYIQAAGMFERLALVYIKNGDLDSAIAAMQESATAYERGNDSYAATHPDRGPLFQSDVAEFIEFRRAFADYERTFGIFSQKFDELKAVRAELAKGPGPLGLVGFGRGRIVELQAKIPVLEGELEGLKPQVSSSLERLGQIVTLGMMDSFNIGQARYNSYTDYAMRRLNGLQMSLLLGVHAVWGDTEAGVLSVEGREEYLSRRRKFLEELREYYVSEMDQLRERTLLEIDSIDFRGRWRTEGYMQAVRGNEALFALSGAVFEVMADGLPQIFTNADVRRGRFLEQWNLARDGQLTRIDRALRDHDGLVEGIRSVTSQEAVRAVLSEMRFVAGDSATRMFSGDVNDFDGWLHSIRTFADKPACVSEARPQDLLSAMSFFVGIGKSRSASGEFLPLAFLAARTLGATEEQEYINSLVSRFRTGEIGLERLAYETGVGEAELRLGISSGPNGENPTAYESLVRAVGHNQAKDLHEAFKSGLPKVVGVAQNFMSYLTVKTAGVDGEVVNQILARVNDALGTSFLKSADLVAAAQGCGILAEGLSGAPRDILEALADGVITYNNAVSAGVSAVEAVPRGVSAVQDRLDSKRRAIEMRREALVKSAGLERPDGRKGVTPKAGK